MTEGARVPVDLTGGPETLLWTLYYRARAASGAGGHHPGSPTDAS